MLGSRAYGVSPQLDIENSRFSPAAALSSCQLSHTRVSGIDSKPIVYYPPLSAAVPDATIPSMSSAHRDPATWDKVGERSRLAIARVTEKLY